MSFIEDLEYPDNKERAERASELGNDCSTLTVQLINDKTEVERRLKTTDQVVQQAYSTLLRDKPDIKVTQVELGEEWFADINDIVSPIVVYAKVASALQTSAKAFLVSEGRLGEAVFADLVGLPKWFRFGKISGGIGAAVLVTAAIDGIIGSERRSQLQSMIHDNIKPRVELKRNAMINATLKESLTAVIMTFEALTETGAMDRATLDSVIASLIRKHTSNVDEITNESAIAALSQLDGSRGSWTNEDQ